MILFLENLTNLEIQAALINFKEISSFKKVYFLFCISNSLYKFMKLYNDLKDCYFVKKFAIKSESEMCYQGLNHINFTYICKYLFLISFFLENIKK